MVLRLMAEKFASKWPDMLVQPREVAELTGIVVEVEIAIDAITEETMTGTGKITENKEVRVLLDFFSDDVATPPIVAVLHRETVAVHGIVKDHRPVAMGGVIEMVITN